MTAFDVADLKDNEDIKKAKIDRLLQKPIRLADSRQLIRVFKWTLRIVKINNLDIDQRCLYHYRH